MAGTKQWEQLTGAEKVEDLRRDTKRLFDAFNDIKALSASLSAAIRKNEFTLKEVAEAVEKIERRLDQA